MIDFANNQTVYAIKDGPEGPSLVKGRVVKLREGRTVVCSRIMYKSPITGKFNGTQAVKGWYGDPSTAKDAEMSRVINISRNLLNGVANIQVGA